MKKKYLALGLCVLSTSALFTGCSIGSSNYEQLKSATGAKFAEHEALFAIYKDKIMDLESELNNVKVVAGLKTQAEVSSEDVKFSSIKVKGPNVTIGEEDAIIVPANSKFNIVASIINASEKDLNQFSCQVHVSYFNGETYLNRSMSEKRFDIAAKSTHDNIEFTEFETKDSSVRHVVTVILKDLYGNEIMKFEKELQVK